MKKVNEKFVPNNPMTLSQYINQLYENRNNCLDDGNNKRAQEIYNLIKFMEKRYDDLVFHNVLDYDDLGE